MIGLALGAKGLAYDRACKAQGRPFYPWAWGRDKLDWVICSRLHARQFPSCPTAYYYRIIDAISRGEKP